VFLKAGESKRIVFRLDKSAFAYYSDKIHDWYSESGEYNVLIAKSSSEVCLEETVHYNAEFSLPVKFTLDSPGGDVMAVPEGRKLFSQLLSYVDIGVNGGADVMGEAGLKMAEEMTNDMPLHGMVSFCHSEDITRERMQMLVDELNEAVSQKQTDNRTM
jgi:beta-glucosidase